ncbi:histidine-rich glycoprotein-like [Scylla paramamosain]|uniref:histidine-rich glycoprotein-like n=1 Tax=Scylla paramamosain TaxID=85552 RepID=UPI003083C183
MTPKRENPASSGASIDKHMALSHHTEASLLYVTLVHPELCHTTTYYRITPICHITSHSAVTSHYTRTPTPTHHTHHTTTAHHYSTQRHQATHQDHSTPPRHTMSSTPPRHTAPPPLLPHYITQHHTTPAHHKCTTILYPQRHNTRSGSWNSHNTTSQLHHHTK